MNNTVIPYLKDLIKNQPPKIEILTEEERKFYRGGIALLGLCISENFFDLPHLPHHNYLQISDGLYYGICYFDDEQLWTMDNKRSMLVVYKIENHGSFCPFRIEVQHTLLDDGTIDVENFKLICHDQSGQRTVTRNLISRENGVLYTQIPNHMELTLSQLMDFSTHADIKQED
jgi:hypothetical protein